MDIEQLKVIAGMTVKLTELRQNECKHLCVENIAPEIFGNLIKELKHKVKIIDPMLELTIQDDAWSALVSFVLAHKEHIEDNENDFGELMPVLEFFSRNSNAVN